MPYTEPPSPTSTSNPSKAYASLHRSDRFDDEPTMALAFLNKSRTVMASGSSKTPLGRTGHGRNELVNLPTWRPSLAKPTVNGTQPYGANLVYDLLATIKAGSDKTEEVLKQTRDQLDDAQKQITELTAQKELYHGRWNGSLLAKRLISETSSKNEKMSSEEATNGEQQKSPSLCDTSVSKESGAELTVIGDLKSQVEKLKNDNSVLSANLAMQEWHRNSLAGDNAIYERAQAGLNGINRNLSSQLTTALAQVASRERDFMGVKRAYIALEEKTVVQDRSLRHLRGGLGEVQKINSEQGSALIALAKEYESVKKHSDALTAEIESAEIHSKEQQSKLSFQIKTRDEELMLLRSEVESSAASQSLQKQSLGISLKRAEDELRSTKEELARATQKQADIFKRIKAFGSAKLDLLTNRQNALTEKLVMASKNKKPDLKSKIAALKKQIDSEKRTLASFELDTSNIDVDSVFRYIDALISESSVAGRDDKQVMTNSTKVDRAKRKDANDDSFLNAAHAQAVEKAQLSVATAVVADPFDAIEKYVDHVRFAAKPDEAERSLKVLRSLQEYLPFVSGEEKNKNLASARVDEACAIDQMKRRNFFGAISAYESALKKLLPYHENSHPDIVLGKTLSAMHSQIGRAYSELADESSDEYKDAGHLQNARQNYDQSIKYLESLLKQSPKDAEIKLYLAESHREIGGIDIELDTQGALKHLQTSLNLFDDISKEPRPVKVKADSISFVLQYIAHINRTNGDFLEAKKTYERLISMYRKWAEVNPSDKDVIGSLQDYEDRKAGVQRQIDENSKR